MGLSLASDFRLVMPQAHRPESSPQLHLKSKALANGEPRSRLWYADMGRHMVEGGRTNSFMTCNNVEFAQTALRSMCACTQLLQLEHAVRSFKLN